MKNNTENNKKQNILLVITAIFLILILVIINVISKNKPYESSYYDDIGIDTELLNIIYFNVGQADSTLITNNGFTMLIDTGNGSDGYYITDFLKAQNISKIDYLILTHLDEDHIGGTNKIVQELEIGTIYMPNMESDKKFYIEMMEIINKNNVKVDKSLVASDELEYSLGKATWKVLNINSNNVNNTNDSSIVIELAYNDTKYLFMGDATTNVEGSRKWNNVNVLKVGHHGSDSSTSQSFLEQTNPKFAIISTNGRYGHPSNEVLERLQNQGSQIYRTDKNHTIWLTSNGYDIKINELDYNLDGTR